MHWLEATQKSPIGLAQRLNTNGNIKERGFKMYRDKDGFAYINVSSRIKPLINGKADGFNDWEPVQK